jgi:hypothetical protein
MIIWQSGKMFLQTYQKLIKASTKLGSQQPQLWQWLSL